MPEKRNKAPAYQWFPKDAESDETYSLMTCEEVGVFERLRDRQWFEGSLPPELEKLVVLCGHGMTLRRLQYIWHKIAPCFPDDGTGRIANPRLDRQREQLAIYIAKQKLAGRAGGLAKTKRASSEPTIPPLANPTSASATASAIAEEPRENAREGWTADACMDAFREGWKTLYGHECSLILKPIQFSQLQEQLRKIPEEQFRASLAAFFATDDPYVRKATHPLGLFLREPLRFLATPKVNGAAKLPDASAFQWSCPHTPTCGNRAACAIVSARPSV